MKKIKTIGIIGFGQFGQFMAKHLAAHFEIVVHDPHIKEKDIRDDVKSVRLVSLNEVAKVDFFIFAVPMSGTLEKVCKSLKGKLASDVLLADVTSVKVRPLEIIKKAFPDNKLLGTHPIFGPVSGKDGIASLPMVLSNVSFPDDEYAAVKNFLAKTLKLKIIEKTPEEHDKEVAYVMVTSHFIGRALNGIDGVKSYDLDTASYRELVNLKDLLKYDSWELFKTIQNENPFADGVREEILEHLHALDDSLKESKTKK